MSKENAIVLRSVARPEDAFSWAEPDSGGSRNVWFPDIRMSGFAPRASSVHQYERRCLGHGKERLTTRVKWTTSDDDFDITIAVIGHSTA